MLTEMQYTKRYIFFLLETLATNSCAIDNLIKNKFTQINNCNIFQMRHLQSKSRWRHKFQYLFSSWGCMLYQIVFCKKSPVSPYEFHENVCLFSPSYLLWNFCHFASFYKYHYKNINFNSGYTVLRINIGI